MAGDRYQELSEEEKIRKENKQELGTTIRLKKKNKTKENIRKIEFVICLKKNYSND